MLIYMLSGFIGLAALMMSMTMAIKRLRETAEIMDKVVARKQAQSERARRAARACLSQRRDLNAARRRKTAIEIACLEVEARLKNVGMDGKRLMVLDDRRTKTDAGWVVRVANLDYGAKVNANLTSAALDAWRKGRRYVVWAPDEAKAREKVTARFPEPRGFYIQGVDKYTR